MPKQWYISIISQFQKKESRKLLACSLMGQVQAWCLKVLLRAPRLGGIHYLIPTSVLMDVCLEQIVLEMRCLKRLERTRNSDLIKITKQTQKMFPWEANLKNSVCFAKVHKSNICIYFSYQEWDLLKIIVSCLFLSLSFYFCVLPCHWLFLSYEQVP